MNQSRQHNRAKADKKSLLANIALLYYGEGLTQSDIAKRMQVSRATIVNMLKEGRDRGIVEIRVDGRHLSASTLARDVRDKFGLTDVYIAAADANQPTNDRAALLMQVARVGAVAVLDIVEDGDRVGVAWGETLMALSEVMPRALTRNIEVCQLIGSINSIQIPASENCAIQVAKQLDANCFTLHAPGLVATAEMAKVFQNEPVIQEQLVRLSNLDMVITSIGIVSGDTHLKAAGVATDEELTNAAAQGAVGVICCRFINSAGECVAAAPDDRLIAASISNLRNARKKLAVVCGNDRAEAVVAAINGNLVTHLCLDEALARQILDA